MKIFFSKNNQNLFEKVDHLDHVPVLPLTEAATFAHTVHSPDALLQLHLEQRPVVFPICLLPANHLTTHSTRSAGSVSQRFVRLGSF